MENNFNNQLNKLYKDYFYSLDIDSSFRELVDNESVSPGLIRVLDATPFQPLDTMYLDGGPTEIDEFITDQGWNILSENARLIYKKNQEILKVAIDGYGLTQNYLEILAFKRFVIKYKQDEPDLDFPILIDYHPKYYWVKVTYINGNIPKKIPKNIIKYLNNKKFNDVNTRNFIEKDNKYYFIDFGYYRYNDLLSKEL